MKHSASKITIAGYDDLFGITETMLPEHVIEQVVEVPLEELYTFKNHPFRVLDDEKMEETVASIKEHGVLMPGIARPRAEGGYEIIAGHRRKHASQLAGKETMPIFIREYSDDESIVIMVDTNIQREDILPSEKAKAYRMKYEAMKHQGLKGGGNTLEELGEAAGESGKTVQRYIWLSHLSDGLLELVDQKKIGIVQGIDLSFLTKEMQSWVEEVFTEIGGGISTVQSAKIKKYGRRGELTKAMVHLILTEKKLKEEKITLKAETIKEYFEEDATKEEMESIIIQLLQEWKNG